MRRTIILAAALGIIVLGLWGTAVIYFDESRLKGIVSDRLSEQVGRRVEIVGALSFSLFPRPRLDAENVVIAGPEGAESRAMMRAKRVSMSLRLLPLFRGELAPAQTELSGAVINLASAGSDGRSDPLAAIRSSARLLSGRSLRLQDLTLVTAGRTGGGLDTLSIEFIEFDRFSLDRTVAFRFRGNLGEPRVLDDVHVDAMLHVPASSDKPVRLRDMQLRGRLTALDLPVSLSGDLTATGSDPFRLALAGGRLRVGDIAYDLSFGYHGGDAPAADLLVAGPELDWGSFSAFPQRSMNVGLGPALAALSERVDLRSQLQFERLRVGTLGFIDARIDLRTQPAGLGIGLAAVFPGGLVEASGVIAGNGTESLSADVSLAEFGRLLDWLGLPAVIQGSGEATLTLRWPAGNSSGFQAEGQFELWDGHWLVGRNGSEPGVTEFDHFSGEVRMSGGYLEIPGFELSGGDLAGTGWAAVELPGGNLGGEILPREEGGSYLALSGTLADARLAPPEPASPEVDPGNAAPLDGEPDH